MEQIETVRREFTKQAKNFEAYQTIFSKEEFNALAIEQMRMTGKERALEVAAGTCAFGRAIAPHVAHITESDATEAMLKIGREAGEKAGVANAEYVLAEAEHLPFEDDTFDIVVSRLAFHHFADAKEAMQEMCRVLKTGGKLVIVDMAARQEHLRDTADGYERLRDPSHVKCLSETEFEALAACCGVVKDHTYLTRIPVKLSAWLDLTGVQGDIRAKIVSAMKDDIAGIKETGFEPYEQDGEIMFDHRWFLYIGKYKQ